MAYKKIYHNPKPTKEKVIANINNSPDLNPENKELMIEYLDYLEGKKTINNWYAPARYITALKRVERWLNHKSFLEVTGEDISKLVKQFRSEGLPHVMRVYNTKKGVKISQGKKRYSPNTIDDTTDVFSMFMHYLFKHNLQGEKQGQSFDRCFPEGVGLIDMKNHQTTEPTIISKKEMEKALKQLTKDIKEYEKGEGTWFKKRLVMAKAFFLMAWDSGLRPNELVNLRNEHVEFDEERNSYFIDVKFPKVTSHKRKIPVPFCTDVINDYIKLKLKIEGTSEDSTEEEPKLKDDELFFNPKKGLFFSKEVDNIVHSMMNYVNNALSKVGVKKELKCYNLRNSSIQHYVDVLGGDTVKIAKRYGWTQRTCAERLDGYLARSKIKTSETIDAVRKNELGKVKDKLIKEKDKELKKVRKEMKLNQQKVDALMQVMSEGIGQEAFDKLFKSFMNKN